MKTKNTLRKYKLFWAWDDHKEEAWLEEMSLQGWHLSSVGIPTIYDFTAGEAQPYIYRLDFLTATTKDDRQDYYQLFEDAGWVRIGEMGGWQYFRKLDKPGEITEIFTDNESKIQKYKRLLGFLAIIAVSLIPMYIVMINTEPSTFKMIVLMLYALLLLIYGCSVFKLIQRINNLRKDNSS